MDFIYVLGKADPREREILGEQTLNVTQPSCYKTANVGKFSIHRLRTF